MVIRRASSQEKEHLQDPFLLKIKPYSVITFTLLNLFIFSRDLFRSDSMSDPTFSAKAGFQLETVLLGPRNNEASSGPQKPRAPTHGHMINLTVSTRQQFTVPVGPNPAAKLENDRSG